jgi:hypothetical protein
MIVMTHPLEDASPAEEQALYAATLAIEQRPEIWDDADAVQRVADEAANAVLSVHRIHPNAPWMTAYVWQRRAIVVRQDRRLGDQSTPPLLA